MNNLFFYDAHAPADDVVNAWRLAEPDTTFLVSEHEQPSPQWERITRGALQSVHPRTLSSLLSSERNAAARRTFIVDCNDAQRLSHLLVQFHRATGVDVFAPKTDHYYKNRPVFINSVPKCGTHLLSACLEAMGLMPPPLDAMPDMAGTLDGGRYYNLQHMRVNDIADQYRKIAPFIDALSKSAIVFIIRDPRDAILSLANYIPRQREYHLLSRFMEQMSAEERINTVILGNYPIPVFINDRYNLDDNIATLFASYERWRPEQWQNLWRVRYEDLVGPKGFGTEEAQREVIWGLQLALHVPGNPALFAEKVFSESSPTFFKATVGQYQTEFSAANHRALEAVSHDFIRRAGYADRWHIDQPFEIKIDAPDGEILRETARSLYCEISTRSHGNFQVLIAEDEAVDPSAPPAASIAIRCRDRTDSIARGIAVHVKVLRGATDRPGYRCTAELQSASRRTEKVDWLSPSATAASEQIVAFCAAHRLCGRIGGHGGVRSGWAGSEAKRHEAETAISQASVDIATFNGSLSQPPLPSLSSPAGLTQLFLRLSLTLLHLLFI